MENTFFDSIQLTTKLFERETWQLPKPKALAAVLESLMRAQYSTATCKVDAKNLDLQMSGNEWCMQR